jgi:hypothetical protein
MVVVQRSLEQEEGVKLVRAQGRMEQLRIQDRLPIEIEYLIQTYEKLEQEEKETASA